jgi:hypothetical protein
MITLGLRLMLIHLRELDLPEDYRNITILKGSLGKGIPAGLFRG